VVLLRTFAECASSVLVQVFDAFSLAVESVPYRTVQEYTDAQKAEVWVKVAEAYLESDETDAADNFCNKVWMAQCLPISLLIVVVVVVAAAVSVLVL